MLKHLIFKLGQKIRNPSLSDIYTELKYYEFASREQLNKLQEKRLNKILEFSFYNSEYYKEILSNIGYKPENGPYPTAFIKEIPILSKLDLIENNKSIHTTSNYKFKKIFFSETSGSSGQALTFYKDEEWDSFNRASIFRGLSWFGINPWDRSGYFWGYSLDSKSAFKVKFFDFLLNRFRIFSYSEKDLESFLNKCSKAKYIEGYSSMIYEVAKLANNKNIKIDNLNLVKGTSEKIYEYYHDESIKAFGCNIVSEYGSAESGIIAFECPEGKMHVNEETCLLEEVEGRAIVTNLVAKSFPTLRYDLGDYIKLSDDTCSCGRAHIVLDEVTGRVGKNIIGKSNKKYPSLTLYYVFKNMALTHGINISYRCEQRKCGFLSVFYETFLSDDVICLLNEEFLKYFDDDIDCSYNFVSSIRQDGKKLKDFESFLN